MTNPWKDFVVFMVFVIFGLFVLTVFLYKVICPAVWSV